MLDLESLLVDLVSYPEPLMSCDMQPCEACICIQEFPGLPHKSPHTGGLKQQKFSLSTFWRLEICNQGVNKAMFPLQALGKDPSLPLIASGSCQESLEVLDLEASSLQYLPPSSSGLPPSMCVSLGLHMTFIWGCQPLALEPTLLHYDFIII